MGEGIVSSPIKRATSAPQRLISLAVSERLITFRFHHPLLSSVELSARLAERFELKFCEVVPTDEASADIVNAKVIALEDAPRGYESFDHGAATKFVLDPHGRLAHLA